MKRLIVAAALFLATLSAQAAKLTIIKAGPVGEVAKLAEANEARVVFSEPMVVLGKVPKALTVPWFHIAPQVKGTFRWSGTTTLIFTPDPKQPLPYASKFDVTIDPEARSVAGNTLGKPYSFSFTTPTIQLLRTTSYRRGERFDAPVVIMLRFNQPVDPATILQHLQLRTQAHELEQPNLPASGIDRLRKQEPQTVTAFEAKRAAAMAVAASDGAPVLAFLTTDWDKKRYPPAPDLVVLETKPGVPPDTHIQLFLDAELARGPKNVRTGRAQEFTVVLDPTLFVKGIFCQEACNPDARNTVTFTADIPYQQARRSITLIDVTEPAHERKIDPKPPGEEGTYDPRSSAYSLDELGYSIQPAHNYVVRIDPKLQSVDGQTLGYTWLAVVQNWHSVAFTSFGDGHGVWESSGGPILPFHARNFLGIKQWLAPLTIDELMPTLVKLEKAGFNLTPDTPPQERKLTPVPDKIQSFGLDLTPVLHNGTGVVWAAMQEGQAIPLAKKYSEDVKRATVVQVTNLGVSVKDSPQNTLVLVTRLDDAQPVAGANVSIRTEDNRVVWTGTTDATGLALAPNTSAIRTPPKPAPQPEQTQPGQQETEREDDSWAALGELHFIVTAEKNGDVGFAASNWHDGISPWEFGLDYNINERHPLLRGTIFSDRGVYKLGEEVHVKAVLRSDTPTGMQLLPAGTKLTVMLHDAHDKEIDKRTVTLSEWSSAEWTVTIPSDGPLGNYSFSGSAEGQRLNVMGDFLVAAYRRPDFRVDVTLGAPTSVAGTKLDGRIVGRYLFGGSMSARAVRWTYSKAPAYEVPARITDRFPEERFTFLGYDRTERSEAKISSKETKLDAKGELKLSLETKLDEGWPFNYMLEGEVTDVSRQRIANRAVFRVDPAPWYIGLKTPPFFADTAKGLDTEVVAAALDGTATAGVNVSLDLVQIQWNSVRKAEGNGFYSWDTEEKKVPAGHWTVTTAAQPVPFHLPVANGGEYLLSATASDAAGHSTTTRLYFYAVGGGYTAWQRYDHNRIDLIPEKKTYKPGETARIMVKSPWEHATLLLTTEREGVRSSRVLELTSTQQTVTVPITERDIPNLYVSVMLIKGRTKETVTEDESDPGKPSFRLGYAEIKVEDSSKKLSVNVKANREEYRPATKAKIDIDVRDTKGQGTRSEVTLWAVDYGVLSLTGYKTPNVLESIYLHKALQVVTEDSREKIISRRVITPKGGGEGGGGGADSGPGMLRKDFRVLAFWLGSLTTDAKGHARTEVTLPESMTTYRIMAVAADKTSRFGWAENEIRVAKPLLLTQSFPRFLAVGDQALFGAVVHNQLKQGGTATVTIKSVDPSVLELTGETKKQVEVAAGGSVEARFDAVAKSVGTARIQMTVAMNGESDGLEDTIPVRVLVSPETVAAYGQASPRAEEKLEIPAGVVPGYGGLHMELSSTAMVGLSEGAQYLIEYPYGCAEQRGSRAFALMLASDLGDAFKVPGIDAAGAHKIAQETVNDLHNFQCGDGGFAYWPGLCSSESPYLTSYLLHVFQRGQKLGYTIDSEMMRRAYDYLDAQLKLERPKNEGWWPAYTSWQAFAVKVLVEGGRNEDSHLTRLYGYVDRMPVFGLSYLADALIAKGEKGPRLTELHRRLSNAILPEGGFAHVEELSDPYLLYFWNSNVRSTAIATDTLVRNGEDQELVTRLVRWMMKVRKNGRWGNTQENAWAMEALVDYYRKYESVVPDFTGVVTLGSESIAKDPFRGRSSEAKVHDLSMREVLAKGSPGQQLPLALERQGTGTLYYLVRLRYASSAQQHDPLDQGFAVERKYSVQGATAAQKSFKAGDLIKVTLKIRNTKERRFVAVSDPIPAGTEPVESWFATTASDLAAQQAKSDSGGGDDWMSWWQRGGFDFVERHDDRVDLFATRLGEGSHEFTYLLRATTAGTFITSPLHAEEMYEPEVFGRTATDVVEVRP